MRRIAEVLRNNTATSEPMRTVYYGQGQEEYERGREVADDKILYDAMCMARNGWTADRERAFQHHASVCRIVIPDGEQLIAALEQAAGLTLAQDKQVDEARAKARALAAAHPYTPPVPPPAIPEPPAFLDDVPPPTDDDLPY